MCTQVLDASKGAMRKVAPSVWLLSINLGQAHYVMPLLVQDLSCPPLFTPVYVNRDKPWAEPSSYERSHQSDNTKLRPTDVFPSETRGCFKVNVLAPVNNQDSQSQWNIHDFVGLKLCSCLCWVPLHHCFSPLSVSSFQTSDVSQCLICAQKLWTMVMGRPPSCH